MINDIKENTKTMHKIKSYQGIVKDSFFKFTKIFVKGKFF